MSTTPKSRGGFTLVELSIVFVIIGLLVGGILVAQSLIDSVKMQKSVRQLSQFDAAVSLFKSRYNKHLPGDSTLFEPKGDGNRTISGSENSNFFTHLSLGLGLKDEENKEYNSTNYPTLPIAVSGYNAFLTTRTNQYDGTKGYRHFYSLRTSTSSDFSGGFNTHDPAKPIDLLPIDKKIDDGLPRSGDVFTHKYGSYSSDLCYNGNVYATSSDYVCTVWIAIGLTNGNVEAATWPPP